MSSPLIPLGQLEDQKLEFKSAGEIDNIAKSKSDLGRSVVAMLNAQGGVIWIGVGEREGRGAELEPLVNPARAIDAVENHILSTITPRLSPGEFAVEPAVFDSKTVLRLTVSEGSNKPYAFDRKGSPFFVRVGSRIRAMTREELRDAFLQSEGSNDKDMEGLEQRAKERLGERRLVLANARESTFWVGIEAVSSNKAWHIEFDLESVEKSRLLTDARVTGSRQGSVLATDRVVPARGQRTLTLNLPGWGTIEVSRDGRLEQIMPIDHLWDRGYRHSGAGNAGLIHPIAWIENLAFPLRVFGAILVSSAIRARRGARPALSQGDLRDVEVVASVAMLSATDVRMRPHSPDTIGYMSSHERPLETNQGHWHAEEVFDGSEMAMNPDRCALQLTKDFYRSFDFDPLDIRGGDGIPRQFDRVSGKLVLPE